MLIDSSLHSEQRELTWMPMVHSAQPNTDLKNSDVFSKHTRGCLYCTEAARWVQAVLWGVTKLSKLILKYCTHLLYSDDISYCTRLLE